MDTNSRQRVFLDVSIDDASAGRLIFELFTDKAPRTCENFRQLCTGEHDGKSYAQCQFHRVIDEFMIQGGDIVNNDGTGTFSIYEGKEFDDENLNWRSIDASGLLCSANRGSNTNGSQFFVTLEPSPHLDGKHTVFGRLVSGHGLLAKIAKVPVDDNDRPNVPVVVTQSGELERKRRTEQDTLLSAPPTDRGRRLSNDPDRDSQPVRLTEQRNRRTSDGAVDEGLRGRPRKRSKQSKEEVIFEDRLSSGRESPVKVHKRKRSSSPSRHRDSEINDDDSAYHRRRRRSLPNQHDEHRDRDRRNRGRNDDNRSRYDSSSDGRGRQEPWRPYRHGKDLDHAQDRGRLTYDAQDDSASGIKFKGRGIMKYRG